MMSKLKTSLLYLGTALLAAELWLSASPSLTNCGFPMRPSRNCPNTGILFMYHAAITAMDSNQPAPCYGFIFSEQLKEKLLWSHSYGHGRFIHGIPSESFEPCFSLFKADDNSLDFHIFDDRLFTWLCAIPELNQDLYRSSVTISMDALLPCYPEVWAKFHHDKEEGKSFYTLELFVCHCLREGSVFAIFGLEHLYKKGILTNLHFHHIQSWHGSMSEDFDLSDEGIEVTAGEFVQNLKTFGWLKDEDVEKASPKVAQIQPKQSRASKIRFHEKVAQSRRRLLDAGAKQNASDGLRAFVGQVGTSESVLRGGTRVIRDISEGYMPSRLIDVVSALQVANAMLLSGPPSNLVFSEKQFVDDIPQWSILLVPGDRQLFLEIASSLWGITTLKGAGTFTGEKTLILFQTLINNLVRAPRLFDHGVGNSWGSYWLRSLRQQYASVNSCSHAHGRRLSLDGWRPLPMPDAQQSVHMDARKPPERERELTALPNITFLMAGAIFGAMLLYLCLSQHDFSIPSVPLLVSEIGRGRASTQIMARNCVIIDMYIRSSSLVDVGSWNNPADSVPKPVTAPSVLRDSPPGETFQERVPVEQPRQDVVCPMYTSSSMSVVKMESAPARCSPSLSSHQMTPTFVNSILPSSTTTKTHGLTTIVTLEDGTIFCKVPECRKVFNPNITRGNLKRHERDQHPGSLPNYQQVLYECRFGCGYKHPQPSNTQGHEKNHCAIRKGKQPRSRGKWREATKALKGRPMCIVKRLGSHRVGHVKERKTGR